VKELPRGTAERPQRRQRVGEFKTKYKRLKEVKYVTGKSIVESAEVVGYVLDALVTGWGGDVPTEFPDGLQVVLEGLDEEVENMR
jgi:hypothetical protein